MDFENEEHYNSVLPQCIVTGIVLISAFATGIEMGWPSPAMPKLLSEEFPLNVTTEEVSYIVTVSAFGDVIGPIAILFIVDRIGRKWSLIIATSLHILSLLMIYYSTSITVLLMARIIGGTAEGGCYTVIPIYICEISEPKLRGILGCLPGVAVYLGMLFINPIGYYYTIEASSLISLIFPLLFIIAFIFMPESPYYLIMKNKTADAKHALKKLRWNKHIDEELMQLTKDVRRQLSDEGQWRDLILIKNNRTVLGILSCLFVIQCFSGGTSATVYAQSYFAQTTKALTEELASMLMILIYIIAMSVAVATVDLVGRRFLILLSILGSFLLLVVMFIFFALRDYSSINVNQIGWLAMACMILLAAFYSIGLGSVVTLLLGELFPVGLKAKGICVLCILYAACIFSSNKLYQYLSDYYSIAWAFLIFAIVQMAGFIYCWYFLMETQGKTLEQIQVDLKRNELK